jgi:lipoprotein-anchoring transpeptidase ErfK/SrfK
MTRFSPIAALLASLLLFSACTTGGGQDSIESGIVIDPASSEASADGGAANAQLTDIPTELYSDSSTRAVVVSSGLVVLTAPGGEQLTTLSPTTAFGTTRVLLVEEQVDDWIRVRLPARPNHRTGWIPASSVETEALELEVYVDLQARSLTVVADDELLVRSPVAIGTDDNPTPLGTFYVTDKLETPDPGGAYGPYALGLSGYSETLTEFAGGDGQIGIHGTNDPDSIGKAVSHGCVRLPNEVVEMLATMVPLGTPVHIV